MISGQILHLQRLSTEDGPGIRTTVFFKGCPLACAWCHNPESISRNLEIQWHAVRCLRCGTCLYVCPNGCLSLTDEGLHIDREHCEHCGECAEACPTGALEALGRTIGVEELAAELLKDRAYYEKSGGGVTLSGGEPSFQPDFAEALLKSLREAGISTALDTCGLTSRKVLDRLLRHTDLVLFDLKLIDSDQHRQFTGQPNETILENLLYVRDMIRMQKHPVDLWIRTPLIPGATDTEENLRGLSRFISAELDALISRWELCAFNNLCKDQYARLGLDWPYAETPLMTAEELSCCEQLAKSASSRPEIILATGATRVPVFIGELDE
ncbi:MAG: glycyl-radical enzyme activating protein [Anaerolineales bacterium]|nr:glycyl-radical enzyme activating protein [Anaerolineales bacterium]